MFEQTCKNIDDIICKDAGCGSELDYFGGLTLIHFRKIDTLFAEIQKNVIIIKKRVIVIYTYERN